MPVMSSNIYLLNNKQQLHLVIHGVCSQYSKIHVLYLEKHVASRHAGQYTVPSTISTFEFMLSPVMQTLNLQGGTHHKSLVSLPILSVFLPLHLDLCQINCMVCVNIWSHCLQRNVCTWVCFLMCDFRFLMSCILHLQCLQIISKVQCVFA